MDNINDLLNEFSKTTEKIIEELENEKYDQVNLSLDNREEIINKIKNLDYDKDELNRISLSLNLAEKEKEMDKAMRSRFKEKRDALNRISEAKYVNSKYKKAYSVQSIFINKKI
jgi:hypothetical protein